jgi:hypothetical protein
MIFCLNWSLNVIIRTFGKIGEVDRMPIMELIGECRNCRVNCIIQMFNSQLNKAKAQNEVETHKLHLFMP